MQCSPQPDGGRSNRMRRKNYRRGIPCALRRGARRSQCNPLRKRPLVVEAFYNLRQSGALCPLRKDTALRRPYHRERDSAHRNRLPGRGIRKLKDAGREVITGVLEDECRSLIRRFITFHTLHRPYITLKWAESADKYIDKNREDGQPVILSTPLTSMLVHKKRAEHSAIMVGTRTAELDNPSLTVRNWQGRSPVRIVTDRQLRLSPKLHVFDGNVRTLVFTEKPCLPQPNVEYIPIDFQRDILPQIMKHLYMQGLQSLLVEGGNILLQSFIDAELWDEAFVEESPLTLLSGIKAPEIGNKAPCTNEVYFGRNFRHYSATRLG